MEAGRVRFLVHALLLLPLLPAFLLDEALDGQERREESHEDPPFCDDSKTSLCMLSLRMLFNRPC